MPILKSIPAKELVGRTVMLDKDIITEKVEIIRAGTKARIISSHYSITIATPPCVYCGQYIHEHLTLMVFEGDEKHASD